MEKGLAVQKEIVGSDAVDAMYNAAPADELHIQRYLSGNCFGDHVIRAGLDLRTRELLTFAMLVSLGGCDPQVKGHAAANNHTRRRRRRASLRRPRDGLNTVRPRASRPGAAC
jgi:4-carboxymuconolactone decarboxylase